MNDPCRTCVANVTKTRYTAVEQTLPAQAAMQLNDAVVPY